MNSFDCLRTFAEHLDKYCKAKSDLKKKKSRLNEKQRLTITCKDDWCKYSTEQLNHQLAEIEGTEGKDCSIAGDTRNRSNGIMKGVSQGDTPESLAPTKNNCGEWDKGSRESGPSSSIGTVTGSYNNEATKAISIRGTPEPSLPPTHDCGQSNEDRENKEISAWPMNIGDIRRALSAKDSLRRLSSPSELLEGQLPSIAS